MSRKDHWESVYESKDDSQVSWTQAEPHVSLSLIAEVCPTGGLVIDVGGGTSVLAERLVAAGYSAAVLDISENALVRARTRAQQRMGAQAVEIQWIVADVTAAPDLGRFDVWHDRAVFHFLTAPEERRAYVAMLMRTVPAGGHAVISTFALDGPEKCSGLPVHRYDAQRLHAELGGASAGFELIKRVPQIHTTPWGASQSFVYSVLRRTSD